VSWGKVLSLVIEFKYMNLWFRSIYIAIHRFVVVKFEPRVTSVGELSDNVEGDEVYDANMAA
jgi:hypothetical protein